MNYKNSIIVFLLTIVTLSAGSFNVAFNHSDPASSIKEYRIYGDADTITEANLLDAEFKFTPASYTRTDGTNITFRVTGVPDGRTKFNFVVVAVGTNNLVSRPSVPLIERTPESIPEITIHAE